MGRLMIATFLILGWGFYELSGGNDFEPPEVARAQTTALQEAIQIGSSTAQVEEQRVEIESQPPVQLASVAAAPAPRLQVVLEEAAVALTPQAPVVEEEAPTRDIRFVSGNVVNMRGGPGTNYQVLTQLRRGDPVQVLSGTGGWVKLRTEAGQIGWMAERLVTR
ncbi:MAG: SH3 domain-containing protein [Shimia sp.]